MAVQGLAGTHKLVPSVRSVTLKTESRPKVRCVKRDSETGRGKGEEKRRGGEEKKELSPWENMIEAFCMLMDNGTRERIILYN